MWLLFFLCGIAHADVVQEGLSSYYGPGLYGRKTASGDIIRKSDMIAASTTLPLGTKIVVTDLITGKSVTVIIKDRGPYAKHRILDLAEKPATLIGLKQQGVQKVRIRAISFPIQRNCQSAPANIHDGYNRLRSQNNRQNCFHAPIPGQTQYRHGH